MKAKIFVVEDDGITASALKIKLENWGYEVPKIVSTSKEAIKHLEDTSPDLVIMDIILKGKLNGFETAELIDSEHQTPIIFYSAQDEEKSLSKTKNLQNREYVQKTCKDEYLKSIIADNLGSNNFNKNELSMEKDVTKNINSEDKPAQRVEIMDEFKPIKEGDISQKRIATINEIKSQKREDLLLEKIENFQDQGYVKLESANGILKPVIKNSKDHEIEEKRANSASNNVYNTGNAISENYDEIYQRTRKRIEQELHNLETHFSDMADKSASQKMEINQLKKAEEEYINLIKEKDERIEKMDKHQQILEKELYDYKEQHKKLLNEMYTLKKQVNNFISILNPE